MELEPFTSHPRPGPTPRSAGTVLDARAPGCTDHLCWAYSSKAERDTAAVQWLIAGAEAGQRLLIVTADTDRAAGLIATVAARDAALAASIVNLGIADVYELSGPIDARAQLARYSGQVAQAVTDGFRGLRVFADVTALISDPARRAGHVRWEHAADAWIAAGNPLAPMCAYDVGDLGRGVQSVMAVHPLRYGPPTTVSQFGLYWDAGRRILDGEIDAYDTDTLAEVLDALAPDGLDLDVSELSFLGARGATVLAEAGGAPGTANRPRLRMINPQPVVRRVWEVLKLDPAMLVSPDTAR
ncbi:MEDS domain-containing protein [Nocardia sp. NPDC003693]